MAEMRIKVDHKLSEAAAIEKLKQAWAERPPDPDGPTATWDGNVLTFVAAG